MKKNKIILVIIMLLLATNVAYAKNAICAYGCTSFYKGGQWFSSTTQHYKYCKGKHGKCDTARHSWTSGDCCTKKRCKICGKKGSCGSHNYSKTCSKAHCTSKVCSICGGHKSTCGGDHTYSACDHCGYEYCTICESHTCSCNNDGQCSDPHCVGITWCTVCGTHEHVPCDTNAICTKIHCGKAMCSVCGSHNCTGGHVYEWITDSTASESQTHTYKCKIDNCTSISKQHTASWGQADITHTSTCQSCSLKYTHTPKWSTLQRNATEEHPCAWSGGCLATHSPSWGNWYKVNGGKDGDSDGGPHSRKCSICGIEEKYHNFTTEKWTWLTTSAHTRVCSECGISQILPHNFESYQAKDTDSIGHSELYKHWKLCTTCDPTHKEVDDLHQDNGTGACVQCGQILWKVLTIPDGDDITSKILDEEAANEAFRDAKREEVIKILEVTDKNGNPEIQYIQSLSGAENLVADNDEITITKNGEYEFTTLGGGTATIFIDNISRKILIDKILEPATSTIGTVTIIVRASKADENFNKKIYIKEGSSEVTNTELANGRNPFEVKKVVSQNGTYYFSARDTAGNTRSIKVVVDNIVNGQATVAISNDVFIKGYVFTEILVNPNKEWDISGDISTHINAKVYKVGETTGKYLSSNTIKLIKVMDMQRREVSKTSDKYSPGEYYIQVAIGGEIFDEKGAYIIDLEEVKLEGKSGEIDLDGKNRIIVEVQDLQNLT